MKIERFKVYKAEVKVKNKSTLRPDSKLVDGEIIAVRAVWMMDETEMFPGQWAFTPMPRGPWIPQEDLILLKEIYECDKCRDHQAMHSDGDRRLCCECYVKEGNPPADWHSMCMAVYHELARSQKQAKNSSGNNSSTE